MQARGELLAEARASFPVVDLSPPPRPLLCAFARLDRPDARLMFVGDGAGCDGLRSLARELGVADRVILAGFQRVLQDRRSFRAVFGLRGVRQCD